MTAACAFSERVEDLALGADDDEAEAHLAGCPVCASEHALFGEERALFTRRALAVAPPPPLAVRTEPRKTAFAALPLAFAAAAIIVIVPRLTPSTRVIGEGQVEETTDGPLACSLEKVASCEAPISAVHATYTRHEAVLACAEPANGPMCEVTPETGRQ